MSVPKTAACKFIESKTITIPGPDKFPEVNPTTVKPVKSNDEGFGDLEDQRYTEDEDKEASARELMRKAASMDDKHDCSKVHPDMTHEKWEALQEKKAYPIDMLRVLKALGAGALGGGVGGAAAFTAGDYVGRAMGASATEPMNLWGVEPGNVGTVPGGAAFGALAGGGIAAAGDVAAQIQEAQKREREEAGEKQAQGSRATEYSPERAKRNVTLKQQLLKETGGQAGSGGVGGAAVGKLNRLPIELSKDDAISAGILQGRSLWSPGTWFSPFSHGNPAKNAPSKLTIPPNSADYAKAIPYRKKSSAADIGANLAKQAFSPQAMGKWLDEPRSLNPDEEEQVRKGKKQWRGTKSHNPEISELMRSPWASAAEGALGSGLIMGGAGALYGGVRGASSGNAGTGALIGGGVLGALGAGAGGFSEYYDQKELNKNLEAMMRQQSEERATISDLERNLMEEEERYRQEVIRGDKQANADEPSQQWVADMGTDIGATMSHHGVTGEDLGNMAGGTVRGAGIGAAAVPGAIGALGGGVYGLLAPGKNREGEQRNRLVEAIKRSLIYGTLGAGAGVAGLGGGFVGGVAGLGNEMQQIGERETIGDAQTTPASNDTLDKVVESSAMTRAQRAYRDAEERLRSFEQLS